MNPLELLFGKKPVQQVNVRDITNQLSLPGRAIPPSASTAARTGIGAAGLGILGAASRMANPILDAAAAVEQAKTVFNPTNNIVTSLQNLGTAIGNQGMPLSRQTQYTGTDPSALRANKAIRAAGGNYEVNGVTYDWRTGKALNPPTSIGAESAIKGVGGKPLYWGGADAGWQQQRPGSTSFPTPLGGGISNAPGAASDTFAAVKDRAYKEEAIRTAQQTASNPLFQKYQVAELTKQYNEAKDPNQKRDIGLQIWAQTNPALAAKLKEGQLGYSQAQAAPGMSNSGGNLIGGLPMPSMNFNFATDVQTPGTMEQNFGAVISGVGMTSKTPMYDREMTARLFATPEDLSNFAFGKALIPDPGLIKMTEDQRRALAAQYNRGLK